MPECQQTSEQVLHEVSSETDCGRGRKKVKSRRNTRGQSACARDTFVDFRRRKALTVATKEAKGVGSTWCLARPVGRLGFFHLLSILQSTILSTQRMSDQQGLKVLVKLAWRSEDKVRARVKSSTVSRQIWKEGIDGRDENISEKNEDEDLKVSPKYTKLNPRNCARFLERTSLNSFYLCAENIIWCYAVLWLGSPCKQMS